MKRIEGVKPQQAGGLAGNVYSFELAPFQDIVQHFEVWLKAGPIVVGLLMRVHHLTIFGH